MRRAGKRGRGRRARAERCMRQLLGGGAAAVCAPPRSESPDGAIGTGPAAAPITGVERWAALSRAGDDVPGATRPTRHRAPNRIARVLSRAGVQLDRSRAPAVATVVAVLVVAALAGAWVLSSRPASSSVPAAAAGQLSSSASALPIASRNGGTSTPSSRAAPPSSATTATSVVVDVAGKVRRPGLYRLPAGSRVDDALRAAGGALPGVDLTTLNRAALVADGQQVAVGVPAAAGAAPGGSAPHAAAGAAAGSGPVHLNSATLEQLETLPGVGPVLAQHILDYRQAHGSFTSVTQLNSVPGIGDAKFAALRDSVAL